MASYLSRFASELGFFSVLQSSSDTKLLCLQRFLRLFAYGASTLILALHLSSLGISDARIGLFMTLTLLGDVGISFLLTLVADGLGRRNILLVGAALMSASGVTFALASNYWVLVAASIFGVISPSGSEIGPFRAIEESTLAQLTSTALRNDIFAWYTLLGNAGTAFGSISCGWIVQRLTSHGWSETTSYRFIFWLYAFLGLGKFGLSVLLSERCELEVFEQPEKNVPKELSSLEAQGLISDDEEGEAARGKLGNAPTTPLPKKSIWPVLSPASRTVLVKICLLFALDSFASGVMPPSWVAYFFTRKFAITEGLLGTLFFTTKIISGISNLVASSIAKRIGHVKTMAFTHFPSAIFLSLIPLPSNAGLAMIFLVLRSCLQNMDQAPKQAFLAAAVLPSERTATIGIVNTLKTLSQSAGPITTGWLAGIGKISIAFYVAGGLKAAYDVAVLEVFADQKPMVEKPGDFEESTVAQGDKPAA